MNKDNDLIVDTPKQSASIALAAPSINSPSKPSFPTTHGNEGIDSIHDLTPIGDALVDQSVTEKDKRSFVSKGERIHKLGTYLSVDWLLNAATGVGFAYWGKYSDLGKKMWSGPLTEGFSKLLSPVIKNPEYLKASVGKGNMFMSIIAGGMFTIPPLMALESKKVKLSITKTFDNLIYGKDKVENDPKFQEAYEEIEKAPDKKFMSGMTSRFVELSPLLAMVLIPVTQKFSSRIYFNHVEHGSEAVARKLGFSAEKSFKNITLPEAKERWKFIHESVAMDFGLGIPYAMLHAFFYNMFAGNKKTANQVEPAVSTASPPHAEPDARAEWANKLTPAKMAIKPTANFVEYVTNNTPDKALSI